MAQTAVVAVENNFTKGLITESTGLNFPENATTSTDNCTYTLIGDVTRRLGFDFEANYRLQTDNTVNAAYNTYKWNNAGGDGVSQIIVTQVGSTLYFYLSSSATVSSPLSTQLISSLSLTQFASSGTMDSTIECQFADGNGYLFVFHPNLNTVYCSYAGGTISTGTITYKIRDFQGLDDSLATDLRPKNLTIQHQYNLQNQGWTAGNSWSAAVNTNDAMNIGNHAFTIGGVSGVTVGQNLALNFYSSNPGGIQVGSGAGSITAYDGNTIIVNVYSISSSNPGGPFHYVTMSPINTGYINTFITAEGVAPSNSDVWWYFKNASNQYDPATTQPSVTLSTGNAPKGHYVLNAFDINRSSVSGLNGLTEFSTNQRPSTGCWFQGRLWATGLSAGFSSQVSNDNYSWTENIYFSQIVQTPKDFGNCFQNNDPTSENLFSILPTDGGVLVIKESGKIYKLFPIQNGLLVFAQNGVWFVTGSQGIGFAANDYTVTQLSQVQSVSNTSFVNVLGLPYFWNEEGIYRVQPKQGGILSVEPITVGTILAFYNNIPLKSRLYARGAYDPINYVIQWTYKTTLETSVLDRYHFDGILNFNTFNSAFYPYTFPGTPSIIGINYVNAPNLVNTPQPGFKYFTNAGFQYTFSEERNTTYKDFVSFDGIGSDFSSFFITGYKLRGQAQRKFQPLYVFLYCKTNGEVGAYSFQGVWDWSNNANSGRWTARQTAYINDINYDVVHRRHKLRGHGYSVQFKVSSISGLPFDIIGWATTDEINAGL